VISSQRHARFKKLQQDESRSVELIQNVWTRWDFSMTMLNRVVRMRKYIRLWCQTESEYVKLYSTCDEWKQIEYMIFILQSFHRLTQIGFVSHRSTLHKVWNIYINLYNHLKDKLKELKNKRATWKVNIRESIQDEIDKLQKYYSFTFDAGETLYNIATILDSTKKTEIYKDNSEWESINLENYTKKLKIIILNIIKNMNEIADIKMHSQHRYQSLKTN